MLEFIIASGIFTILVGDITCGLIISKVKEDRGYVGCCEVNNKGIIKKSVYVLSNFIPVVNLLATAVLVYSTVRLITSNEKVKKETFDAFPDVHNAVDAKKLIDNNKKLYDELSIKDAMKIDGATEKEIKNQIKIMNKKEPTLYNNNKYMKKINAMSDAELWLQSIYMDAGLSLEEKKELFSGYTKDFMRNKQLKKSKTLEKTIKMTSNHEYK